MSDIKIQPESVPAPVPDNVVKPAPVQPPVAAKANARKSPPAPEDKPDQQPESDPTAQAVPGEVEDLDDPDEDQGNPILKRFRKILYWTGVVTALAITAVGLLILAVAKDTGYELVFLIAAAVAYGIGRISLFISGARMTAFRL